MMNDMEGDTNVFISAFLASLRVGWLTMVDWWKLNKSSIEQQSSMEPLQIYRKIFPPCWAKFIR